MSVHSFSSTPQKYIHRYNHRLVSKVRTGSYETTFLELDLLNDVFEVQISPVSFNPCLPVDLASFGQRNHREPAAIVVTYL